MSEPAKFVLNDELWRNLPRQFFQDTLLCSCPQDAVKWLVVSKDTKEFIEKNRNKMRLFEGQSFVLAQGRQAKFAMVCAAGSSMIVDVTTPANQSKWQASWRWLATRFKLTPPSPMLNFVPTRIGGGCTYWRLTDTSPAGIRRFVKIVVAWVGVPHFFSLALQFAIGHCFYEWESGDLEGLRPLAKHGVPIRFVGKNVLDDALMDAIESLQLRNIDLPQIGHTLEEVRLRSLRQMPLEQVTSLRDSNLLEHLDAASFALQLNVVNAIIMPWFRGERPRLKTMSFTSVSIECRLFEPVDFVPTALEAKLRRRVFLMMDKKGEHAMEVNVDLVRDFPRLLPRLYFSYVEMRIVTLV